MVVSVALIVCLIGLIVYLAASYPWTKGTWVELGKICFWVGLLVALAVGGKSVL